MSRVALKPQDPTQEKLDLLAVPLFEGEALSGSRGSIDGLTGGVARHTVGRDFKGKARETVILYANAGSKVARVMLVGLGKREKATLEAARKAAGAAIAKAHHFKAKTLGFAIAGGDVEAALGAAEAAGAFAEASILADYKFERHKSGSEDDEKNGDGTKKKREPIAVSIFGTKSAKGAKEAVDRAAIVAEAANLARDLANEPANFGTPTVLAEAAKKTGKDAGFKVKVLDRDEMEKLGMGALLGVARGSEEPPRFIIMEHEPPAKHSGKKPETVVLIGKGITFDSGGISIKPADKMWEMKFDKSGGCAVIGAMSAVARLGLGVRVVGLVPATENLPSGTAIKPGDVVSALNGKTIEVQNTDAEGRLILADALAYSARYSPASVVDMATLTGACVIALGEVRAGVLGTSDELIAELKAAGEATGELVWPLPLDDAYGEQLKSDAADLKNIGGRSAGAITAGFFLKHFAPKEARWAHLDIAGTAWGDNSHRGYVGKGSSGFGVRLLLEWLRAKYE